MMVGPRALLTATLTALAAAGCTYRSAAGPAGADVAAVFATERAHQARLLEYRGDLARALEQWRLVHAVRPRNAEAADKVKRMAAQVRERSETHRLRAMERLAAGEVLGARRLLLASLAYDPGNRAALERLRVLESRTLARSQMHRLQQFGARRVDAAMFNASQRVREESTGAARLREAVAMLERGEMERAVGLLEAHLRRHPDDVRAQRYLVAAQRTLAGEHQRKGELEAALRRLEASSRYGEVAPHAVEEQMRELRNRLAEQLYSEGVRISGDNLARAVDLWQLALSYNAAHRRAQLRLEQAYDVLGSPLYR